MGEQPKRYTEDEIRAVLQRLAENGGNVSKTERETGIRGATIRRWRGPVVPVENEPCLEPGETPPPRAATSDERHLRRFRHDSWTIIHKANEIVKEKVEDLGPKDAASIAAGYFDRQAKAEERLNRDGDTSEEYAAEWGAKKE